MAPVIVALRSVELKVLISQCPPSSIAISKTKAGIVKADIIQTALTLNRGIFNSSKDVFNSFWHNNLVPKKANTQYSTPAKILQIAGVTPIFRGNSLIEKESICATVKMIIESTIATVICNEVNFICSILCINLSQ